MKRQAGFSLIEMMVAVVVGSLLITSLFRLWTHNQRTTDLIANKGDFRDKATLATTQLNRSITMAGFGISKMDVMRRQSGSLSDTLVVYSNTTERRTTLVDTAAAGTSMITVFKDSGFTAGCFLGITDSIKHEYARVDRMEGDSINGFRLYLIAGLGNSYLPGVPDIYPVQRERFYADAQNRTLVRFVDDRRLTIGAGVTTFRVQFLDLNGNSASTHRDIRVVTFSISGNYKAPTGSPSTMSFSSTVIPRNIL